MPYSLNHSQLGHIERGKCKRAIIVHSERNPSLNIFFRSSLFLFALSFLPFHVLLTLASGGAYIPSRDAACSTFEEFVLESADVGRLSSDSDRAL